MHLCLQTFQGIDSKTQQTVYRTRCHCPDFGSCRYTRELPSKNARHRAASSSQSGSFNAVWPLTYLREETLILHLRFHWAIGLLWQRVVFMGSLCFPTTGKFEFLVVCSSPESCLWAVCLPHCTGVRASSGLLGPRAVFIGSLCVPHYRGVRASSGLLGPRAVFMAVCVSPTTWEVELSKTNRLTRSFCGELAVVPPIVVLKRTLKLF